LIPWADWQLFFDKVTGPIFDDVGTDFFSAMSQWLTSFGEVYVGGVLFNKCVLS